MKYRIVRKRKGEEVWYAIEKRYRFLFWTWCQEYSWYHMGYNVSINKTFKTYEEAKEMYESLISETKTEVV